MAGAEVLGRLNWLAVRVVAKEYETPHVSSILFERPMWAGHMAGQHVDIRLTAEDGYQAQRSYSIASAPGDDHLVLTVERLEGGEVSPYLFDVVEPGDELEMRGPIGRYFVWGPEVPGPVLMIAGGSGVVPFRAMIRHRAALGDGTPFRLIYSARTIDDVIYRDELEEAARNGVDVRLTLTRQQPEGWEGYGRRIDREMLGELMWPPADEPVTYICGPTGFVELASDLLVELGQEMDAIRTERFGPTGA